MEVHLWIRILGSFAFLLAFRGSMSFAKGSPSCQNLFAETQQVQGYHASPELHLTLLDPAYSRNTSRYGPGVYFYAEATAVEAHALAIKEGRIKYDKIERPPRIYQVELKLDHVLDMKKIYSLSQLKFIFSHLQRQNIFSEMKESDLISGQEFYDRLTSLFAESVKVSLDRGVVGLPNAKAKVNEFLLSTGIEVLVGEIPIPHSSHFEKAYISLRPVRVPPTP
jgi:hypothetical protein